MSAKRLSKRDRAYYLVGRTVMRLLDRPWPSDEKHLLHTMHDLIGDALTPEEYEAIFEGTRGYTFITSRDFEEEANRPQPEPSEPSAPPDDDIPF